ncbi:hypothetical protein NDN08_007006 [Rhodosorus marinus]|uniref:Uncharacterized protein n=1 Tax=Rhodosorus marinus TaxID=101924 RepID=A0AAV8UFA8_9RHOD|nr:hypothetical protein NDN08_007006 [Rhodosorus marinus]
MKYGLVVILLAGIFGLTVADVGTCANFVNPLFSSYTISSSCFPLQVEGETVGSVSNKDVVKTQGPNKGETCTRFTFVVREGLGIRRAKLGLWLGGIPRSNARFTRKRKFLDSEPTTVRVDACLDDIKTDGDCCSEERLIPALVVEAKVRMEDGKVRIAGLSFPIAGDTTCSTAQGSSSCTSIADANGDGFVACTLQASCSSIGEQPEFGGINRINRTGGVVEFVLSPGFSESNPPDFALELTLYEKQPEPLPSEGIAPEAPTVSHLSEAVPAQSSTVIRRPVVFIRNFDSFSVAVFNVPELYTLNTPVLAFAVELTDSEFPSRYSVRVEDVEDKRRLLQFISFASTPVFANSPSGPVPVGQIATNSLFGPLLDYPLVGRIGSVICGEFRIGVWSTWRRRDSPILRDRPRTGVV